MTRLDDTDFEPTAWLLVFHISTGKRWLDRLIPGRFKHVSAIGYVPASRVWLLVDVALDRLAPKAVRDDGTLPVVVARTMAGNGVLRVRVDRRARLLGGRLGFWCVPAMKHLVGARSGALRPDRLWRDLVAQGAEIVADVGQEPGPEPVGERGR